MAEMPITAVLMFVTHRAAETEVMAALVAAGADNVTVAQARLLMRLDHHGMRIMKLAERMGVTKQSAGELVDQLKRSGYVVLSVDPTDGGARLVILNATGLALSRTAAMASADVERKWREHLGEKAFHQMREGLVALKEITDPYL